MDLRVENLDNCIIHNDSIEIYNPEKSYNNLIRYTHFTRFPNVNQMPKPDRSKRRRNEKTPAEANPSPSRVPKRSKRPVQHKETQSQTLPPSNLVSRNQLLPTKPISHPPNLSQQQPNQQLTRIPKKTLSLSPVFRTPHHPLTNQVATSQVGGPLSRAPSSSQTLANPNNQLPTCEAF